MAKSKKSTPEEDLGPSKSELKRQMHALQEIGESLVALSEKQLNDMPIESESLREAIEECRKIGSNSARKRHLQYIGKLMRHVDPAPIQRALALLYQESSQANINFHQLELLRDEVLAAGPAGVEKIMQRWPAADRQQLRQLVLEHQREQQNDKPAAASRRLFKYLRELQQS
jgi:ribosome-associated protein